MIVDPSDVSIALASLAAVLALVFVAVSALTACCRPSGMPPGPWGVPLFGNALQFGDRSYITWAKWVEDYGQIFTVKVGPDDWVILNDYESVKQVTCKLCLLHNNRWEPTFYHYLPPLHTSHVYY